MALLSEVVCAPEVCSRLRRLRKTNPGLFRISSVFVFETGSYCGAQASLGLSFCPSFSGARVAYHCPGHSMGSVARV